jgi:hypothetical protein
LTCLKFSYASRNKPEYQETKEGLAMNCDMFFKGAFWVTLLIGVKLQASEFQVTERGPSHKVWQRYDTESPYDVEPKGRIKPHEYIELGDGICYLDPDTGTYQDTVAAFEEFTGKGFVARRGQIQVVLSPTLQVAGVDIQTAAGRFRGHVLGLSYYSSASGKSAVIAEKIQFVCPSINAVRLSLYQCRPSINAAAAY